MAIRGLREARDIDVVVTKEVYDAYRAQDGWVEYSSDTGTHLKKDDIELWYSWGPGEWNIEELLAGAEMIDGLPFVPLPTVLRWKEGRGQPKDAADVERIRTHLADS